MKIVSINGKRVETNNPISRKERMERELYMDSFALGLSNGMTTCMSVTTAVLGVAGIVSGISNRKAGPVVGGLLSVGLGLVGVAAAARTSEITDDVISDRAMKCAEAEIDLMEKVEQNTCDMVK